MKCFMNNAMCDWDIRETPVWLECTLDARVNTKPFCDVCATEHEVMEPVPSVCLEYDLELCPGSRPPKMLTSPITLTLNTKPSIFVFHFHANSHVAWRWPPGHFFTSKRTMKKHQGDPWPWFLASYLESCCAVGFPALTYQLLLRSQRCITQLN